LRSSILGFLAVITIGCAGAPRAIEPADPSHDLTVRATGTPLIQVASGDVSGLVPGGWAAQPIGDAARYGFVASPAPRAFDRPAPRTGVTASWVDATVVGVPSDYYYLAATGPLLADLFGGRGCRVHRAAVIVDRTPTYLSGPASSPGDFVARGAGTCLSDDGARHPWSYFVAAPGYGPVRQMGITRAGLYVAAAVTRAGPGATSRLQRLLADIRFGPDGIAEMIHAARGIG
jgi:hypothetical protein